MFHRNIDGILFLPIFAAGHYLTFCAIFSRPAKPTSIKYFSSVKLFEIFQTKSDAIFYNWKRSPALSRYLTETSNIMASFFANSFWNDNSVRMKYSYINNALLIFLPCEQKRPSHPGWHIYAFEALVACPVMASWKKGASIAQLSSKSFQGQILRYRYQRRWIPLWMKIIIETVWPWNWQRT